MNYCRNLKFEEKPDYTKLRKYLQDVAETMHYDHDYYYDWILKNSSMSKRMSKTNIPLPPKIVLENDSKGKDENENTQNFTSRLPLNPTANNMIISNSVLKQRNISVEPPIIRRDSYNNPGNIITGK
uniref:Uncharacterized protein n=1 Tax=Euplotes harpa TaxID=151035 RepID=A0A7S3J5S2_9SPIT|mmetsp:Transcript_21706/g.24966  ORF Transcript_21706/g.24966 Transcript_21706/m.24966 type:complete len:127 (+) Transcript_21706:320-700(+)